MLKDLRFNRNQRGVTVVLVAILMVVFLGLAALAIDISHLYLVRNEVQNAADAGSLAGARVLYNDEGTAINPLANQVGHDAAEANRSENISVEVNWTGGNVGDVQRGHWSFGIGSLPRGFYASDSLLPVDLWNVSTQELDQNPNFINAVKVTARREASPAASFFARIFGYLNFPVNAEAVAYIGFAGTITPGGVDQPVAICQQAILNSDKEYTCYTGRMINSGNDPSSLNTAGWTNYSQPCGTANRNEMKDLVCGSGNPSSIIFGNDMGATNGEQDVTFRQLRDCWLNGLTDLNGDKIPETLIDSDQDGIPDQPWRLTLPVVCCGEYNQLTGECTPEDPVVGNCMAVVGVVEMNILWITESGTGQVSLDQWGNFPIKMGDWHCDSTDGPTCWNKFKNDFNLKDYGGNPIGDPVKKSIYFKPECSPQWPVGGSGGPNFGILARIPVLVK